MGEGLLERGSEASPQMVDPFGECRRGSPASGSLHSTLGMVRNL